MAVSNTDVHRILMTAPGDAVTGQMFIKYVRYVGTAATATGEQVRLNDGAGRQIFKTRADGAEFIDVMPVHQIVDGISLMSITSGEVMVYCR